MSAATSTPGSRAHHDRGLHAVRRVRASREQDSRLGLSRALADLSALREQVEARSRHLTEMSTREIPAGSPSSYAAHRAHLNALGHQLGTTRTAVESTERVVAAAREHWLADHRRLESVDVLLQNRHDQRAAEATRRGAREDDETAVTLWRRGGGRA